MKLLVLESLLASLIVSYVNARIVSYAVIAFCDEVVINVNGNSVKMTKESSIFHYGKFHMNQEMVKYHTIMFVMV